MTARFTIELAAIAFVAVLSIAQRTGFVQPVHAPEPWSLIALFCIIGAVAIELRYRAKKLFVRLAHRFGDDPDGGLY